MMTPEYPSRDGQPLWQRMLGRTLDVTVSLAFLLTVFPLVYVVVACVGKLRSPGPAIVLRRWPTADGRGYGAYTFRLPDEDSLLARLPRVLNLLRGDLRLWVDVRVVESHPPVSAPSEGAPWTEAKPCVDEAPTMRGWTPNHAWMEDRPMEAPSAPLSEDVSQPSEEDTEIPVPEGTPAPSPEPEPENLTN